MIALPGLLITTGRSDIARTVLLAFARYVDGGMLPNNFPDAGGTPEYNTVDAASSKVRGIVPNISSGFSNLGAFDFKDHWFAA